SAAGQPRRSRAITTTIRSRSLCAGSARCIMMTCTASCVPLARNRPGRLATLLPRSFGPLERLARRFPVPLLDDREPPHDLDRIELDAPSHAARLEQPVPVGRRRPPERASRLRPVITPTFSQLVTWPWKTSPLRVDMASSPEL